MPRKTEYTYTRDDLEQNAANLRLAGKEVILEFLEDDNPDLAKIWIDGVEFYFNRQFGMYR